MSILTHTKNNTQKIYSLLKQNKFSEADRLLNDELKFQKTNSQLWHFKSITSQNLGRIDECEFALNKVISLEPNHLAALSNLAKLQTHKQNTNGAITTYKKILNLSNSDTNALFHLGVLLNRVEEYAQAQPYLESAHNNVPNDINIKIALGQSHLNQGNLTLAIKFFDKVLSQDNNNLAAINNKGIALKKQCLWHDAITLLQRGVTLAPNIPELLKNLASCYTLIGDFQQSKSIYEKVITLAPLDTDAHHWLNQMLWEHQDPSFLDSYYKVIEKNNNATDLMFSLSHKLNLAGRSSEAQTTLEKILKINQNHIPSKIELSRILREQEHFSQAHDQLTSAANLKNSDLLIQEELGISYLSLGEASKALQIFEYLTEQTPLKQSLWSYKGIALKLLGRMDEYNYLCNYDHLLIATIDIPKGFSNLKEFNKDLVNTLRDYHHAKTNPLDQSLQFGSQTSEKLFDYHAPIIQTLRQSFREKTVEFLQQLPKDNNHPLLSRNTGNFIEADSWSVILHNSGFHKNHHHPVGWYSGPYYAQLPEIIKNKDQKQGWVKFGQPGFKMTQKLEPDLIVQPTEGMMIRFPSYFWHGTNPFESNVERITVPGDIIPV
jgi:tetratricopeptide (TPR) repeat protein